MFAQARFHRGEENAQHFALQGCVALKKEAQPHGRHKHLLTHS